MQGDLCVCVREREREMEESGSTALPWFNRDTVEGDTLSEGFHPSSVCSIAGIRLHIRFDPIAIGEMASKCSQNRSFLIVEICTLIGSGTSLETKICANGIDVD